jgi:predicted NAD/FAD-dependent oxidoreductase
MDQILIIGAGLSGLVAARELQNAGHEVRVVDKGRGVGGRMATRRIDDVRFDHGAQFFTTRSDEFQSEVQNWIAAGVAKRWFDGFPSPENKKPDDEYSRFCGTQGMTGIAKYLAQGLNVRLNDEIERVQRTKTGWTARSRSGQEYSADKLLLTCPVPQSLALFETSGEVLPTNVRAQLESVSFEPCFAVLVFLKNASKIPAPGALYVENEPISWIGDNFQKGIATRFAITIHSTGTFAKAHYSEDQDEVGKVLIEAAQEYLGSEVESFQVRRWRYAKPENALQVGALHVPELKLSFAGDGLNGAKIEGAFLSGIEAARVLGSH